MKEPLNEEKLEGLYWEFDERRRHECERDVFKYIMRKFTNDSLRDRDLDKKAALIPENEDYSISPEPLLIGW